MYAETIDIPSETAEENHYRDWTNVLVYRAMSRLYNEAEQTPLNGIFTCPVCCSKTVKTKGPQRFCTKKIQGLGNCRKRYDSVMTPERKYKAELYARKQNV